MKHKLTISIDEKVYKGLHKVIGRGNISRFLEDLARPYVEKKTQKLNDNISTENSITPSERKSREAFLKLCDELAQTAKRNGMTEEILKSILADDGR